MIRRRILFLGMILLGLAAFAGPASAHLLPAQSGTLHLTGNTVFGVIDIPAGCLPMADDNHDGLIDGAELQRHRAEIIAVFQQRFHVTSDGDPSHSVIGLMLPQADDGSTAGSGYVMAMQRITFKTTPRHLTVSTTLFDATSGELGLSVRNDDQSELVLLTPEHPSQALFRSPLESLAGFIGTGVMHILSGMDHLLFLLTIVIGLRDWRQALLVTSAFTIAHSLTLGLSATGVFRLPPAVVEPAIAASIVIVAVDNLLRGMQPARRRLAIIFGCGLLHGLGFASAITDFGIDWPHRMLSLAGFNIGVEIGQFAFLGAALGSMALTGWLLQDRRDWLRVHSLRLSSGAAAGLGSLMFILRL
jgi:hydrogenase/urease accessory protein HupE